MTGSDMTHSGMTGTDAADADFVSRLFDVIEHDIVPKTRAGVAAGN